MSGSINWMTSGPQPVRADQCCVTFGPIDTATACPGVAVEELTVGCAHEHLGVHKICGSHPELAGNIGALMGNCRRCFTVDGHECRVMLFSRTPLSRMQTSV